MTRTLISVPVLAMLNCLMAWESMGAQQTVQVTVIVTDPAGRPVSEASVSAQGTPNVALTDSAGHARLALPVESGIVWVRKVGFRQQRLTITSATRELSVVLEPLITLAPVRVEAARGLPPSLQRRRLLGTGTFYGPHQLASAHSVRSVLRDTPQLKFEGSGPMIVTFSHTTGGDCYADVYVDGTLSAATIPSVGRLSRDAKLRKFEELEMYSPGALYAIEVYPRGAQAPQNIVSLRDGCGVILLWTRSWAERQLGDATSPPKRN